MKQINTFAAIISIFLSIPNMINAQYTPLNLGNVWVYESSDGSRGRVEIIDSAVLIDSIRYFGYAFAYQTYVSGFVRLREDSFYVNKEDSTFPEPFNEYRYYKKNALLGDTWEVDYGLAFPAIYTITDTFPAYTFDTLVTGKMLNENFGLVEWDYVWTEKFGKLSKLDWLGETQYYLRGCIINGNVYGDTTFVVSDINDNVSVFTYELFQNYPNPFNSSTTIIFTVPESYNVTMEVYNLIGEKIETLINEPVNAGKHSLHYEARDISSGIYFYVLRASNFIQTKKMVLIR